MSPQRLKQALQIATKLAGLLLAFAGVWHLMRMSISPYPIQHGPHEIQQWISIAVVPVQIFLGIGVFFFPESKHLNVGAFCMVTSFFAFQLYNWFVGNSPCDCLVIVKLPPSKMVIIDSTLAIVFLINTFVSNRKADYLKIGLLSFVMSVLAIGVVQIGPRIFPTFGQILILESTSVLESIPADGEMYVRFIWVRNNTRNKINLVGGTSHCQCSLLRGLPRKIEPFTNVSIPVLVRSTIVSKSNQVPIELYSDSSVARKIRGSFYFRSFEVSTKREIDDGKASN